MCNWVGGGGVNPLNLVDATFRALGGGGGFLFAGKCQKNPHEMALERASVGGGVYPRMLADPTFKALPTLTKVEVLHSVITS